MATENLQMKGFDIEGVGKITAQNLMVMNGASIQDLVVNGQLTIVDGAQNGYVLMSDANGNASWQSLSFLMNGDNLGNHIATQDLDMKNYNIMNADMLEVESVKINGSLAYTNGAVDGYVLTSDSNGNGHWRPISTVVNGDGLGNHRADIDLDMNGHSIIAAQQINADTLSATTVNVTTVGTGAQIHSPTLHGDIDVNGTLTIPAGAALGYVLTSDVNGTASWQAASGGGNGDNLGNHVATMDLDMNGNILADVALLDANQVMADTVSTNNVKFDSIVTYVNGASLSIDWSLIDKRVVEVNQDTIISFDTDPGGTVELSLVIRQNATGNHNVTFASNSNIKWSGGSSPILTGNGNSLEIVDCYFYSSESDYLCNRRASTYF
jgi:hypothetical protein